MNIYQRINECRKEIAFIRKDKKVEGYMAVTHDAVTSETRELFVKHGIVFTPVIVASTTKETGTVTARGTPLIRFEARYRFDVVNVDEPTDRLAVEIEAHAIDHGDKAPGKALSYAKKYAVLKLLDIETGEEEEGRQEQFKPKASASASAVVKAAGDGLSKEEKAIVEKIHTQVVDFLNADDDWGAYNLIETSKLEVDEKLYLWSLLDSKQRSAIKKQSAQERKAA